MKGAKVYLQNDAGTLSKRTISDELLHAELQYHRSPDTSHVLTIQGLPSKAKITSFDEKYAAAINQTMRSGDDYSKYKDTVKTILQNFAVVYNDGWNMVSVPTNESDMRAIAVFPEKSSALFKYTGGYATVETTKNGEGYWTKFASAIEKEFNGTQRTKDTSNVNNRWNIIGSIGYPVPVDSLREEPPGLINSNFFGYNGAYFVADTLVPGQAYWVKANNSGLIIATKPGLGANANYKNYPRNINVNDIPKAPDQTADVPENSPAYPREFALTQNYPNPFNPTTAITYSLPHSSHAILKVYDFIGREIMTLVDETLNAGTYTVNIDGSRISSGIYFYRLQAGLYTETKKLVLIK